MAPSLPVVLGARPAAIAGAVAAAKEGGSRKEEGDENPERSAGDCGVGGCEGHAPMRFVALLAACAALNSTNIGFDIGVGSGVALLLQRHMHISDFEVGLFLGSIHFLAALGSLHSHAVTDRLGRRRTFTVAQVVLLLGLTVSICAPSFGALMLGRIFVGLGVGLGMAIDPLYIAELAPAKHRGKFTSWPEIAINFGILVGFFANWLLSGVDEAVAWRLMIGFGTILPCVLVVLSLAVMPESPRWLIARGRLDEATDILRRTHSEGEDVASLVDDIRRDLEEDREASEVGWRALLCPGKDTRRMVLIGLGVAFAQQINGSESVVAYSPTIFARAGVATTTSALFAATMLVGAVKTGCVIVAAALVDARGRRPLLVLSTAGAAVSLAALAAGTALQVGWLSVVAVCAFMAVFSLGLGPIPWLLAAEVFPSQLRAKGVSLAAFVNRCTSGTIALTFLPLSKALGGQAQYFAFFGLVTAVSAAACFAFVPETKQRTLEQLQRGAGRSAQAGQPKVSEEA